MEADADAEVEAGAEVEAQVDAEAQAEVVEVVPVTEPTMAKSAPSPPAVMSSGSRPQ